MATVRSFHKYRGVSTLTIGELVTIVGELLAAVAPHQTRYKVTEKPTGRTVRFYTAQGLVDKPGGKDGPKAQYGYRHILQVLAIKYLQSQYLPLLKVRSLIEGASNRELESIIPEISGLSHRGYGGRGGHVINRAGPAGGAGQPVRDADDDRRSEPAQNSVSVYDAWRRIEVSPGVELHVHERAMPDSACERLRAALLRETAKLRGWVADEEQA